MSGRRLLIAVVCLLGTTGIASAQESGDTGLVMGYPASLGIVWHVTDRIAIRPAVDFQAFSSEFESGFATESTGWALGLSVGALYYLQQDDRLRTYVVPEFSFARSSGSTEVDGFPIETGTSLGRNANQWGVSGSFGGQYSLSERFGVFGEVGVAFTASNDSDDDDDFGTDLQTRTWGTRGAVGVILYF